MKKPILSFLGAVAPVLLMAQLTINVSSIPANTPPGSDIYVVGNFNNWNPSDPGTILSSSGNGSYTIVIDPPQGALEFKFTRGGWNTVEGNASGGYIPNREYSYNGQASTIDLVIAGWEDQIPVGGTAAPNVSILDPAFYMPQLQRNRRIWIYLPPDYQTSNKHYPVLYMHDGQNLFDVASSAFGEWEVDESLNTLFDEGDYGCIVIGIDNGEEKRLDEYSPWENPQYGGGEGEAYIDFIFETLKPYVDANFRTLPGRNTTAMMGSSMGGLITQYALIEHQDKLSKAGVFSPAFWFAGTASADHVTAIGKNHPVRVYFLAGGQEPASVTTNLNTVADAMLGVGFQLINQQRVFPSDGQHSEWFWRREFPDAYEWLFAGAVSASSEKNKSKYRIRVLPNPAGEWVQISGLKPDKPTRVQVWNGKGQLQRDTTLQVKEPLYTGDLPAGHYTVRARQGRGKWAVGKFVR